MTLKDWLTTQNIRQAEFARAIGEHPSTLTFVTQGKRQPTYSLVRRVFVATRGAVGLMDWPEPRTAEAARQA